jgi:MFS family permease
MVAAVAGLVFNFLGGLIAEHGWRSPYWVYAVSFLLVPPMALSLYEPRATSVDSSQVPENEDDVEFRPFLLAFICLLGLLTGLVFLVVPVHLGYLYEAIGVVSPPQIGVGYGLNSLGVIAGTLLFGWVLASRWGVSGKLGASCAVSAVGFILLSKAHTFGTMTLAAMLNGIGCGVLLPTMVTWTMRSLPAHKRGFGNGAYQSAFYLGMFVNPVLVIGIQDAFGSRAEAIAVIGAALLMMVILAMVVAALRRPALRKVSRQVDTAQP